MRSRTEGHRWPGLRRNCQQRQSYKKEGTGEMCLSRIGKRGLKHNEFMVCIVCRPSLGPNEIKMNLTN